MDDALNVDDPPQRKGGGGVVEVTSIVTSHVLHLQEIQWNLIITRTLGL